MTEEKPKKDSDRIAATGPTGIARRFASTLPIEAPSKPLNAHQVLAKAEKKAAPLAAKHPQGDKEPWLKLGISRSEFYRRKRMAK